MVSQTSNRWRRKLILVFIFSVAMALVEAAVVVYLRTLYYPEGFTFPLKMMPADILRIEIAREAATIVMLLTVAAVATRRFWEKFAFFIFAFGVWDIFYYIYLKLFLDWPLTILDWDILFLIPLPWIGPVLAPLIVSVIMIVTSILILRRSQKETAFRPPYLAYGLTITGISAILYTFMVDTDATLKQQNPQPFLYLIYAAGVTFLIAAMIITFRGGIKKTKK